MVIEEGYGNNCYSILVIENYPNLQSIVVQKDSLQNLKLLKICNCEKLKSIVVQDGEEWEDDGNVYSDGAFDNVKNVIIESI